ncbi:MULTISPECIES: threonine--tRNA ligase [unclassified Lentimonas]|uniref:threonine--tRNA ligase n=1 Tax=unclassified Lentimonas TaxID=2630993 RepID=UPI00132BDB06|nr:MULTISPECIES: threonine--tRNA ligase [unclassified Lentimonas]CAA6678679.1 Threonyl-tRNA synthetase (EC [Lentimonas sp. CC4]CAA6683665.1 Threonyl-tRNA synthetase (EC [Lentimonas sp. CC6]CAA6691251.1 Threonyl-tRNA synthetase (EC [Lentimonas sp. CC19]CAA6694853.1 Threonyl-tRNA synthetase (EC [Lentimonas sp. CC10]CAA7071627.1 Threonyl-tRNA synthetase (EC [Lentimonas sp. CC11]
MKEMSPLEELRHSCSHVLATAILRLFPKTQLDIGPPTDNGFYYDIDLDKKLDAADLEAIEAEMKKVIKENQRFTRIECSREDAIAKIKEIGQETYKIGRLDDIPEGEQVSFYQNGEFIDLCAGPHVGYTKKIKAFKLLSIAGAYHRGDEKNKQLQRIYGTAFPSKVELTEYLERLEQAKARDHRKLGKELKLFHIDEAVGAGLTLWTPNGAVIRQELQNFISEELRMADYDQVFTPHIGKLGLYRTSGHFPYYKESQFPPIVDPGTVDRLATEGCSCSDLSNQLDSGEVDGYLLKPMNCPMHIKIFDSQPHSYRDLPVRLAEFGTVYRWEQSGELNGLTRVRGFTQDDAHLFCTEDQISQEIKGCLDLVKLVFNTLGMSDYRVRIGLRDPDATKYVGDAEKWDKAEEALRDAAKTLGVDFVEEPGEAAFYGPKIDFVVKDVIGREWQLGTVQVDYNLPERFDLNYIGADNEKHRPVMLHRAPFGSMERFCGVLIEHFAGSFPTWLAPEQVRILPMNDDLVPQAREIEKLLKAAKIRVTVDAIADKLGAKIRKVHVDKVPNFLVLGKQEAEQGLVKVNSRANKSLEGLKTPAEFVTELLQIIANKTLPDPKEDA